MSHSSNQWLMNPSGVNLFPCCSNRQFKGISVVFDADVNFLCISWRQQTETDSLYLIRDCVSYRERGKFTRYSKEMWIRIINTWTTVISIKCTLNWKHKVMKNSLNLYALAANHKWLPWFLRTAVMTSAGRYLTVAVTLCHQDGRASHSLFIFNLWESLHLHYWYDEWAWHDSLRQLQGNITGIQPHPSCT